MDAIVASSFVARAVAGAVREAQKLGEMATDVIETRTKGYRDWDPEIIRIDKELESFYVQALQETGWNLVILSEELRRKEVLREGERIYAVCDPFDGSALYRRRIRAFWFTALALYDAQGSPLAAAVGDILSRKVEFSTPHGSFVAPVEDIERKESISPNKTINLGEAYLAAYLMKPHFLYPTVELYKALFSAVKFVLPNGGPCGFADVASGRCDIYLAFQQPMIEVFAGLPIALSSGCIVTDFEGNPVTFDSDINRRYNLICSCTDELHQQVLTLLREIHRGE